MKRAVLTGLVALVVVLATGCPTRPGWQEMAVPVAQTIPSRLTSVSCWTEEACVAAGWSGRQALVLTRDGARWMPTLLPQAAPDPGFAGDPETIHEQVRSVSCTDADFCVAVGTYMIDTSPQRVLIWQFDGSTWHHVDAPLEARWQLDTVACTGPTYCLASASAQQALQWDGSTWSVTPQRNSYGGSPRATCTASHDCVLLQQFWHSGVNADLQHWDGTTWTREWRAPGPHADGWPVDVSCRPGRCVAVGSMGTGSGSGIERSGFALIRQDDRTWARSDPGSPAALLAVSCAGVDTCVALSSDPGRYAVWTGPSGWRNGTAPVAAATIWTSVSCAPDAARCVAVGYRRGESEQAVSYQFTP